MRTTLPTMPLLALLLAAQASGGANGAEPAGGPGTAPLPPSAVFPRSAPPAQTLLHASLLETAAPVRLALTVLQGLVNREQPRIYLTQDPGWHGPALIPKWVEGLKAKGHAFTAVAQPLSLFTTFRGSVAGAVLYEDNLEANPAALHKLNALTLYCALFRAVPLTAELNGQLRLPVLFDARGQLNTAREAYEWAYRRLWRRASHQALALTCPSHIVLRDYLVAHRILPFWISQEMSADDEAVCLRFLDETESNSPVLGCWGGYGEKPAGRVTEPRLQRLVSDRGDFIVVTDGCFNLTVHSGLAFKRPPAPPRRPAPPLNSNRVYVCYNFTDGDNLQYVQQYFGTGQWWADPNRGAVPLSWSMNPSAADLMPDVLEHYLGTCTPNDEFVCSTAGIGIAAPSLHGRLRPNGQQGYERYLQLTGAAMRRAGFTMVHVGDTSGIAWTQHDFDRWALRIPGLFGILADYGPAPGVGPGDAALAVARGVPVARALVAPGSGAPNEASAQALADAVRAATPPHRPAFMHVSLINWFNSPTVVVQAVAKLGPQYLPVLPSELFSLMRIPKLTALRFQFADGDEGWRIANELREMAARDGAILATTTGLDPSFERGNLEVPAAAVKQIGLRMKVGPGGSYGQLFFATAESPEWDERRSLRFDVIADGEWHEYALPVAQTPEWRGTITGIRLDPTCLKADLPVAVDYLVGE